MPTIFVIPQTYNYGIKIRVLVITFNDEKIFFTGGGSGGHVIPAKTIITEIHQKESDIQILYIGGKKSIERKIIEEMNIKYFPISTGKLRRYFSVENATDFFRFIFGIIQSVFILLPHRKNSLIFSTGGFVALPVVIASKILGIKSIIHEQTLLQDLQNKNFVKILRASAPQF